MALFLILIISDNNSYLLKSKLSSTSHHREKIIIINKGDLIEFQFLQTRTMSGKSPRKLAGGKRPTNLKSLQNRLNHKNEDVPPHLSSRPRRFSLIYSSDSSLSDIDDRDAPLQKNSKRGIKVKGRFSNATGKNSKLIGNHNSAIASDSGSSTASSNLHSISEAESDDEDEDDDDDSSSTSSEDDVDFVKLTAERKKNAMKQLNALKRGEAPAENLSKSGIKEKTQVTPKSTSNLDEASSSELSDAEELAFNFKGDDGIKFGNALTAIESDEDLGEEINEGSKSVRSQSSNIPQNKGVDSLAVPTFSDSEDSEYNIDQEAYFKTLEDDNENVTGIDTGLETGDDEMAILDVEEQNMVRQLENDEHLSFDGSIHEDGPDPAMEKKGGRLYVDNGEEDADDDDEDYDDDHEIMSDFDMPFYEDPKFSNLYYYDGSDQPLTLSTSLPLVLNQEKRKREERRQLLKKEREERLQRLQNRKTEKREHSATPDLGEDEYVFGLFFQSDDEKPKIANNFESPLRRLSTVAVSDKDYSDDEEYDNILLNIAHMPTEDDDSMDNDDELIEDDADEDDISVTNVFIDIDDLDPDAFYFHYDSMSDEEQKDGKNFPETPDDMAETVVFVDDESTDEDETLPPPNTRKRIGSKAKEVVSANVVGLKPPRLGTWQTDNKPFSIIDGLSTKSLYPPIHPTQQIVESKPELDEMFPTNGLSSGGEKEELTLNELLNMSELEDEGNESDSNLEVAPWYHKPSVPLSAFRNKGLKFDDHEDDYMLPVFSARKFPIGYVGSERTRRKIDRMKEIQRKKDEKIRKIKKKKKLIKLRREKERLEKQKLIIGTDDDTHNKDGTQTPSSVNMASPDSSLFNDGDNSVNDLNGLALPRKNSIKGLGMDDIDELLKSGDELLEPHGKSVDIDLLGDEDTNLLVSLAAPIDDVDFDTEPVSNIALWRRRHSMVEAAAENLRVTKNGLFSETALADLEDIIGGAAPLPN